VIKAVEIGVVNFMFGHTSNQTHEKGMEAVAVWQLYEKRASRT